MNESSSICRPCEEEGGDAMRRYRFCGLVVALFFALAGVLQAQEGAQSFYGRAWQAWQGVKDYTCILSSYNRLGDKEEYKTYEYWYLKPGYVRMKVIKGKGKGGEVFYDPHRDKVRGHKGGSSPLWFSP